MTTKANKVPRIGCQKTKIRPGNEKDNDLSICTWNVKTLLRPGALQELKLALKDLNADIVGIQEMRWDGDGILQDRKGSYDIYYSGKNKGMYGVGFAVHAKYGQAIIDWSPINDRLCKIRLRTKFYNTSIICAYAPTEDAEEMTKDLFYDQLDTAFGQCPSHDMKLIVGDFNAKLGREKIYRGIIGNHSLHNRTSSNGDRLVSFAAARNMVVKSTFFPHRNIHKGTWKSPDHHTVNQIDHVIADARHASSVLDVRAFRGPCVGTDHYLVKAKVRQRISTAPTRREQKPAKLNIEALKLPNVSSRYVELVRCKLESVPEENMEDPNIYWPSIRDAILASANEALGKLPPRRRNPWFDDECEQAIHLKNDARRAMLQRKTRSSVEAFNKHRTEAYRLFRRKRLVVGLEPFHYLLIF